MTPTLIACSHGTSSPEGRAAIAALLDQVRDRLPGVRVVEAFVDVQEPAVDRVLGEATAHGPAVVVPVLLSSGYHTRVDIARAVSAHPGLAVATPALGPHDALAAVLGSRLAETSLRAGDAVVLAAAGSTDPAAEVDVREMASRLAELIGIPVSVGFAAGAGIRIGIAVRDARERGAQRVVIASYVLAPGHFADVIARAGGDIATAPLAPDERLAAIVAERFEDAALGFAASSTLIR